MPRNYTLKTLTNALLLAALLTALTGIPARATQPSGRMAIDLGASTPAKNNVLGNAFSTAATPDAPPDGLTSEAWARMQALMREARYQFTWQVSQGQWAYRAPNPAHGLSLAFAADGLTARHDEAGEPPWDFGLSLAAYGEQSFPAAINAGGLVGRRERVEYRWGQGVTEWYVNAEQGVEHGLTLSAPPPAGDTVLTYNILGSLTPTLDAGGQSLQLLDTGGQTALLYDRLAAYDATQRQLPARFELRGTQQLLIHIDDSFAAYPITVDPLIHRQVAKRIASDAEGGDYFGWWVAIDGDTLVAGALFGDGEQGDAGAAYVFERNQGGADAWGEVAKLTASDGEAIDLFGHSVAISGDTLVVGAPYAGSGVGTGAAYVFERDTGGANAWGQVAKLVASDPELDDNFGWSVAIGGDTLVVAAQFEDSRGSNAGAAYVFERDGGGAWGQVAKLVASDAQAGDRFGESLAIDGDMLVVGAQGEDSGAGAAYVFECDEGGVWGQVAKLAASDAEAGDLFGYVVAIDGDTLVVGAQGEDSGAGAAYVFERDRGGANAWGQAAKLVASDAQGRDYFGVSVAISGDTLAVGAQGENKEPRYAGAAYIFERNIGGADAWGQVARLTASDAEADDYFGQFLALSGDTLVVGAPYEDSGGDRAGATYVFELTADLTIAKRVDPASAAPGQPITYTLTFSNAGASTATGVVITDTVPVSVTVSSVISSGVAITPLDGTRYAWSVADLAPGTGGIITVTGVLSDPLAAHMATNTATITTTAPEQDTTNNSASVAVAVQNVPPVAMDDTYATPEDTPLSVSAPGVLANDSDPNGDPLTAVLDSSVAAGTLALQSDGSFAYTPTQNFSGDVTFTYHAADGAPGNTVPVTIAVTPVNDAPAAQNDAEITNEDTPVTVDVLGNDSDVDGSLDPASVTVLSGPANGSTGVNPATGAITYTPHANWAGTDNFTYQVCDDGSPLPAECSSAAVAVTVRLAADLMVSKQGQPASVVPGRDTIVYTLVVTNPGPSDVSGATLTDSLPAELENPTWTCAGGACPASGGSGSLSHALDLAAGDVVTYLISGTVKSSATSLVNTATITANVYEIDPDDNSATVVAQVTPQADLAISKSSQRSGLAGTPITYTIVVRNLGPSDAIDAIVNDDFPPEIINVIWSCVGEGDAACDVADGTSDITNQTVDLPAGGMVTYVAVGTVNTNDPVVNRGRVDPPPGVTDPATENNQVAVNVSGSKLFLPLVIGPCEYYYYGYCYR